MALLKKKKKENKNTFHVWLTIHIKTINHIHLFKVMEVNRSVSSWTRKNSNICPNSYNNIKKK